ncbi:hypothetical protein HCN44_001546 [Aphidius gifuensis]|uniref:ubiquitinyl hydrolase 1 n=1 Tax=Aphidius gifuensis TaxID=684658 RepID=A0A834XWS4_APHGI|nr:ubiquitin carboxyl-terminal hydrolase 10 [Aphidius gifuensis]KAF7992221.1 hypothetical protein HCN44_001546 [Aphidius gifuensis]
MGINMDFKKRLEYKFINLDGLDENAQQELKDILKSDIPPEIVKLPWTNDDNNCIINNTATTTTPTTTTTTATTTTTTTEIPDASNEWQQYDDNVPIYDMQDMGALTAGTVSYPAQYMQVQYPEWQYTSAGGDANVSYPSYVSYAAPVYQPQTNGMISASSTNTTDRRRGINRSHKSDYNPRIINDNISQNYMIQPNHYNTFCQPTAAMQYIRYIQPTGTAVCLTTNQHQQQVHHTNNHQHYPYQNHQTLHQSSGNTKHHQRSSNQYYFNPDIPKNFQNKTDKKYDVNQSLRQLSTNNNTNDLSKKNVVLKSDNTNGDVAKKIPVVEKKLPIVNNDNVDDEIKKAKKIPVVRFADEVIDKKNKPAIIKEEIINITPIVEKNNIKTAKKVGDVKVNGDVKGDVKVKNIESTEKIQSSVTTPQPSTPTPPTPIVVNDKKPVAPVEVVPSVIPVTTSTPSQSTVDTIKTSIPVIKVTTPPVIVPAPISSFASALKKKGPDSSADNDKQSSRYVPIKTTEIIENSVQQKTESSSKRQNKITTQDTSASSVKQALKTPVNGESKKTMKNDLYNNSLDDPNVYRMGEFLLNYEIDKQTVSLIPRGLTNRSNYCYINSILQALLACPPFYNLFKSLSSQKTPLKNSPTPLIDNMIKFINEFTQLSSSSRLSRLEKRSQKKTKDTASDIQCGTAFEPSYVYTMLKNTSCSSVFSIEGRQEDAEEFLSCLLNGISDEMLELMKQVSNDQTNDDNIKLSNDLNCSGSGDEEWTMIGPKNKGSITRCTEIGRTPLSDIFRGQLRSRISRQGDQYSDNVQPFFTLQLDIEKAESVEGALELLVGRDQVEGMICSKTKQQIQAWKQVTLEELPVILILHLKWFNYQLEGCSKIFKNVSYAIDLKIDSKILTSSVAKKLTVKEKQYKLFAVTYHDGKEATKGHYVTDAFHVSYGAWVRYDDSSVKGVSQNDVLNPSTPRVPYLLYYRRSDTIGNNQTTNMRTR